MTLREGRLNFMPQTEIKGGLHLTYILDNLPIPFSYSQLWWLPGYYGRSLYQP